MRHQGSKCNHLDSSSYHLHYQHTFTHVLNVMLLEMSPQPQTAWDITNILSQTSSCRCCNKSQHLHLHSHVHRPYTLSSCTLFCHDSQLQSQSPVSGSAELWSISGQGSDLACHQQYLLQQHSAVEPKNNYRCHQSTALHFNNKLPHHYISNNKFCTRYFYQLLYIYIYIYICSYICICVYVCMYMFVCL